MPYENICPPVPGQSAYHYGRYGRRDSIGKFPDSLRATRMRFVVKRRPLVILSTENRPKGYTSMSWKRLDRKMLQKMGCTKLIL
jgi:hypothetical protein